MQGRWEERSGNAKAPVRLAHALKCGNKEKWLLLTKVDWLLEKTCFKYHLYIRNSPEVSGRCFMLQVSISPTQKCQKDIWDSNILLSGSSTSKPWKNEVGFCFVSFQCFWIMCMSVDTVSARWDEPDFFPRNNFCSPSTALNEVFLESNLHIILEKRIISSNRHSATKWTELILSIWTGGESSACTALPCPSVVLALH